MRLAALALLIALVAAPSIAFAQQFAAQNFNSTYANATFISAKTYVDSINTSGYLIFSPNLTSAYKYLAMAQGNITINPNLSVFYSTKAQQLAQQQYGDISYYKADSLPVIAIFTIAMAVILAKIMVPVKAVKGSRRRKHG